MPGGRKENRGGQLNFMRLETAVQPCREPQPHCGGKVLLSSATTAAVLTSVFLGSKYNSRCYYYFCHDHDIIRENRQKYKLMIAAVMSDQLH